MGKVKIKEKEYNLTEFEEALILELRGIKLALKKNG